VNPFPRIIKQPTLIFLKFPEITLRGQLTLKDFTIERHPIVAEHAMKHCGLIGDICIHRIFPHKELIVLVDQPDQL
jgi:hypothetical protein